MHIQPTTAHIIESFIQPNCRLKLSTGVGRFRLCGLLTNENCRGQQRAAVVRGTDRRAAMIIAPVLYKLLATTDDSGASQQPRARADRTSCIQT